MLTIGNFTIFATMNKIKTKYNRYKRIYKILIAKLVRLLRIVKLPGFEGMPLYDVLVYFVNGFTKGYLLDRAAAVAFNVFLAIFPAVMVLFTIIPYLHIDEAYEVLLNTLSDMLPGEAYGLVETTITEIVSIERGGLFSIGILLAFYFSISAVTAFFRGFDMSVNRIGSMSWFQKQFNAAFVMIILVVLLISSTVLIAMGNTVISKVFVEIDISNKFVIFITKLIQWLLTVFMLLVAVSVLYYFANPKRIRFKIFTPGSLLFTGLFIVVTIAFKVYINNFSRYNALYGSIGGLLIFLLWMYFNCILILIGYELNISIAMVKQKGNNDTIFVEDLK